MVPKPFIPTEHDSLNPAVIITTPYSSGCCIAKEVQDRGYKLICLWSMGFSEVMKTHVPKSAHGLKWNLVLDEQESIEETAELVLEQAAAHGMDIVACLCGGEAGVDLADALSESLGLLSNGTSVRNRRDKKVQQELIKKAGLRSTRQVSGTSYTSEVEEFLLSETYPIIVKPLDSAGSDGVKLCNSMEEAKQHFLYLLNDHSMVNGGECHDVLCQEFLKGKEYVVDHVSRNGVISELLTVQPSFISATSQLIRNQRKPRWSFPMPRPSWMLWDAPMAPAMLKSSSQQTVLAW